MPRSLSTHRTPISQALIELRTRLGDSQQAFSNRLGVALQTVTRWETSSPPTGMALSRLGALAVDCGHPDLSAVFATAAFDGFLALNEEFDRKLMGGLSSITTPRAVREVLGLVARTLASMAEPPDATPREKKLYRKLRKLEAEVNKAREDTRISFPPCPFQAVDWSHAAGGKIVPTIPEESDPIQSAMALLKPKEDRT
jgi:transcriptional regulator with XRE-family HTH domain